MYRSASKIQPFHAKVFAAVQFFTFFPKLYGMFLVLVLLSDCLPAVSAIREADCIEVEIVQREEWLAKPAIRTFSMAVPVKHVIIQHTADDFCNSMQQCIRHVQFIQEYHMDYQGWSDIGYNFLVGGDGKIYEARGWTHVGAHSINFNTNSLGVAFIGNFNSDKPSQKMADAVLGLIECGVRKGYLTPSWEIHGHKDVACTESPGTNLYATIRQWPHYKGGRLPLYHC